MKDGAVEIKASQLTAEESTLAQGQNYSSGLLTSQMTFTADSGYVEIRADMPEQQGFWSSLWMLPIDGGWTASREPGLCVAHTPEGARFVSKPERCDLRQALAIEHGKAHGLPVLLKEDSKGGFVGTGAHFAVRK